MSRLLGIGDNTVDTYTHSRMQYPGGNAVNVAVFAQRLGAESGYLGCFGTDAAGSLLIRSLRAEGVDLSHARNRRGANARAFITHDAGDRRFLGSHPGVRGQYDLQDDDYAYVRGFDVAHTSIYSELDHQLPRLRDAGVRISFDFSDRWKHDRLRRTLPYVDSAFLSAATESDEACERLLRQCLQLGAATAVVTRGARGAMAAGGDGAVVHQPVVPATVVDTLGAGDGFIAAFLIRQQDGGGLGDCMQAGARFAARVCGWQGGYGHGEPWNGEGAEYLGS